jgi:hypothetical protein
MTFSLQHPASAIHQATKTHVVENSVKSGNHPDFDRGGQWGSTLTISRRLEGLLPPLLTPEE